MPLDDALTLVARSFEKFLQAEKDKVAALSSGTAAIDPVVPSGGLAPFLPPPKEISYLLNLLADNRQLTVDELDKVMAYLMERKEKMQKTEGIPPPPPVTEGERADLPTHMIFCVFRTQF